MSTRDSGALPRLTTNVATRGDASLSRLLMRRALQSELSLASKLLGRRHLRRPWLTLTAITLVSCAITACGVAIVLWTAALLEFRVPLHFHGLVQAVAILVAAVCGLGIGTAAWRRAALVPFEPLLMLSPAHETEIARTTSTVATLYSLVQAGPAALGLCAIGIFLADTAPGGLLTLVLCAAAIALGAAAGTRITVAWQRSRSMRPVGLGGALAHGALLVIAGAVGWSLSTAFFTQPWLAARAAFTSVDQLQDRARWSEFTEHFAQGTVFRAGHLFHEIASHPSVLWLVEHRLVAGAVCAFVFAAVALQRPALLVLSRAPGLDDAASHWLRWLERTLSRAVPTAMTASLFRQLTRSRWSFARRIWSLGVITPEAVGWLGALAGTLPLLENQASAALVSGAVVLIAVLGQMTEQREAAWPALSLGAPHALLPLLVQAPHGVERAVRARRLVLTALAIIPALMIGIGVCAVVAALAPETFVSAALGAIVALPLAIALGAVTQSLPLPLTANPVQGSEGELGTSSAEETIISLAQGSPRIPLVVAPLLLTIAVVAAGNWLPVWAPTLLLAAWPLAIAVGIRPLLAASALASARVRVMA